MVVFLYQAVMWLVLKSLLVINWIFAQFADFISMKLLYFPAGVLQSSTLCLSLEMPITISINHKVFIIYITNEQS